MPVSGTISIFLSFFLFSYGQENGDDLIKAAQEGNLARVQTLIEKGVPINDQDRYGQTALAIGVQAGKIEVVRYLLKNKADVNIPDSFYGVTPLAKALWGNNNELATLLLQHGGEPREMAFSIAMRQGDPALLRAVIEAGPINASSLESARAQAEQLDTAVRELLGKAQSRPDPEPTVFTAEQLSRFVGNFEGFESDTTGVVTRTGGNLFVAVDGAEPVQLEPTGDRDFRAKSGSFRLSFVGRAGTIEGFLLFRGQGAPDLLRHSVAEPVKQALASPADAPEKDAEPVVHWPGFRGPNGTGIGDGKAIPSEWDLAKGDGILWTAPLEGLGNSSPVVWGDRVFITTSVAEGGEQKLQVGAVSGGVSSAREETVHHWFVCAYDKANGRQLWRAEVGKGKPLTQRHVKATQANSTPATDGKHVVAVFPTAGLACMDFSGNVLWHHDLGGLNASAFYDPDTQWGFAASPIIYGSTVILQVDVYDEQYIAAWDLATGKQVWRTQRNVATSWSTPVIFPTKTGDELVVNGSTIYGYDPKTGKELWRLGPNSELVIAMPVVGDGVVYVSAGYPPVKPIYAVRAGLRGKHEVEPGSEHVDLLWSLRRGGAYMPTPLLYRGFYFVVHHNGRLVVYDPKTGVPVHKARFSQRGTFTGSPVAVNGKIYIPTEDGILYVVDAKPGFKELAAHEFDEPLMATPAVSDGILLVRTPSRLIAIGESTRKVN